MPALCGPPPPWAVPGTGYLWWPPHALDRWPWALSIALWLQLPSVLRKATKNKYISEVGPLACSTGASVITSAKQLMWLMSPFLLHSGKPLAKPWVHSRLVSSEIKGFWSWAVPSWTKKFCRKSTTWSWLQRSLSFFRESCSEGGYRQGTFLPPCTTGQQGYLPVCSQLMLPSISTRG